MPETSTTRVSFLYLMNKTTAAVQSGSTDHRWPILARNVSPVERMQSPYSFEVCTRQQRSCRGGTSTVTHCTVQRRRVPLVDECFDGTGCTTRSKAWLSGPARYTRQISYVHFRLAHITRSRRLRRALGSSHFHDLSIDCYELSITLIIQQQQVTEGRYDRHSCFGDRPIL